MVVVFEHGFELGEVDFIIVVVVVLLELALPHLVTVALLDQLEVLQVPEDSRVKLAETVLVHLLLHCVDLKDELSGLAVVLVQRSSCAHEFVEVDRPLALEVDIVEHFGSLLPREFQLGCHPVDTEEVPLVGEKFELVLEVADLVVVEAREGLEVVGSEHLVAHLNNK